MRFHAKASVLSHGPNKLSTTAAFADTTQGRSGRTACSRRVGTYPEGHVVAMTASIAHLVLPEKG